jgi:hypothetical protein
LRERRLPEREPLVVRDSDPSDLGMAWHGVTVLHVAPGCKCVVGVRGSGLRMRRTVPAA